MSSRSPISAINRLDGVHMSLAKSLETCCRFCMIVSIRASISLRAQDNSSKLSSERPGGTRSEKSPVMIPCAVRPIAPKPIGISLTIR